jgi:hypothetical protein
LSAQEESASLSSGGCQLFIRRPFDGRQNVMLPRNQRRFARLSLLPGHLTWRVIRAKDRVSCPSELGRMNRRLLPLLDTGLNRCQMQQPRVTDGAATDLLVSDGNLLRRKATGPFHLFIRLAKFNRPALDQGDRPDLSRPATGKFALNRIYNWRLHLPVSKGGKRSSHLHLIHPSYRPI